jgi:entericidin A
MKRVLALVALIAAFAALAGCNTVHGFGEDMGALGHSISNAAK